MKKDKWIWMPHPGHFICANNCKFIMNTYVGGFIVSTVGEYFPQEAVREIFAKLRKIELEGIGDDREADYMKKIGYEELGFGRLYETMVFKAGKSTEKCCPYRVTKFTELDFEGYSDPGEAYDGHLKLCLKWSKKG